MKNQNAMMMMGGGAALAVGSFLTWGSLGSFSASGIEGGDGWFTLIGGAVVATYGLMAYQGKSVLPRWLAWAGLVVGLGVAVINLFDILDIGLNIGIGMWLMMTGGIVASIGVLKSKTG